MRLLLTLLLLAATACAETASWRSRYLLGPGDLLDLSVHGHPDLTRRRVPVLGDGTLDYLDARGIKAEGATVDELRARLEQALSATLRLPRVIAAPVQIASKRYVILGKVVDKGVYSLDRPTTLLEAVARARGIETGLFERNTVELADLPRSFIVRGGRRLNLDFEALFLRGDLNQNIELEPGDYIFFPSSNANTVHILGAVRTPGVQGVVTSMTTAAAIALRGGFTRDAYRSRILIIRGSLSQPETLVVDLDAVLAGRQRDQLLEPRDIVYISERRWKLAEDLLDTAINTFLQSATASWANENVGPWLPSPVLPQTR